MSLTSDIYGVRASGLSHGDVFTSARVVRFMLDLIGYTVDKDLSKYTILEPSFGVGDFLIEIQHRILQSAQKFNYDASYVMSHNVYGCEIDETKYDICMKSLRLNMPNFFSKNLRKEDFLFSKWSTSFDYIIGNPPYVRYENIPSNVLDIYKSLFYTFHYRCDLYVLFYEHCLMNLSENGRHCFICSNRWLKNKYGRKLRALISSSFNLEYLIDIEKLDVFKQSVLAYPAITLISNTGIGNNTNVLNIPNLDGLTLPLPIAVQRKLNGYDNWDSLFTNFEYKDLSTIEQQGFVVGIGVATGADRLFISANLKNVVESELLLPIVNAKDLTGNEFHWRGQYILNTYDSRGQTIDLNNYPKAQKYLNKFKHILENRHIVKKGRVWFSFIDKIKPQLLTQPKILLPDISNNNVLFVDTGKFYPAHNIYYITGKPINELKVLAAILMSQFVRKQIECISNKMNGGIPRWQSQSIKKLKIPKIANISPSIKHTLVEAYHNRNLIEIDKIVNDVVRSQPEISISHKHETPKSLFDFEFY